MSGYFCIELINFMLKGKILLEYANLFMLSVVTNMKRYLKKEELIEILKIHGLTNNIEDYQKIYSHI